MTESAVATYFRPRRLAHSNLWVNDIAKSEDFYRDTCGLMIEFTEPDLEATFMGVGRTQHDLGMMRTTGGKDRLGRDGSVQLPGTVGLSPGLNHIAWEVENEAELVQAYRNLRRDGIAVDTAMDHQIAHSVYLFDPDGNYLEFYCDLMPDWRSVVDGDMDLLTSRWDPEAAEGFTDSRVPHDFALRINEAAPIHPHRVTHVTLSTTQPEVLCDFYSRVGGMTVVDRSGPVTYLRCSADEYEFGLAVVEGPVSRYEYVSFEIRDDRSVDDTVAALTSRGRQPERIVDLPWKSSVFLRDPDGLTSEWYVRKAAPRDPASVPRDQIRYAV